MHAVGACAARSRLGQLPDRARAREAVLRIPAMRSGISPGGLTIRDLIEEGRL